MRQRSVSTADNGASHKDNGIGLSLAKQQSTDDRGGEETATTVQRPMGDGGGEIQQSALILGGGGRWSGLDRVLSLGGEGLSQGAREGWCIRGRGRDKRAHCDINTLTEV